MEIRAQNHLYTSLPGVAETAQAQAQAEAGAASAAQPTQTQLAQAAAAQDFATDMQANPGVVNAIKATGFTPTAEGMAQVNAAAQAHPQAFSDLVTATNRATLTMGQSAGAMQSVNQATVDFINQSGLGADSVGNLNYMLARVAMLNDTNERDMALDAMKESLSQAQEELKQITDERERIDSGGKVEIDGKMVDPAFADRMSKKGGAKGQRGKALVSKIETKRTNLDQRMTALQDTIKILQAQIASQQVASSAQVNEAILMMVEQSLAIPGQLQQPGANGESTNNGSGAGL